MARFRLDLQYDGSGLHGWARQVGVPTVEAALDQAFAAVLGVRPSLTVAGRTDAGVHAKRQVVSLDLPEGSRRGPLEPARLVHALNALTPDGIAVTGLAPASEAFDARRDALGRSYRYFVRLGPVPDPFQRAYTWHVPIPLDVGAMEAAARSVEGFHDLTAFTPTETRHVVLRRTVRTCRWRQRGNLLWLEIEAPTFLRHMVRALVGTMVEVGRGRLAPDDMARMLRGAERAEAGPTAPPQGLFLWRVTYPSSP